MAKYLAEEISAEEIECLATNIQRLEVGKRRSFAVGKHLRFRWDGRQSLIYEFHGDVTRLEGVTATRLKEMAGQFHLMAEVARLEDKVEGW